MPGRLKGWLRWWLLASMTAIVCLGQYFPSLPKAPETSQPLPPGAARIMQMQGDVSVLQDSYPWLLSLGDVVKPQQIILTGPDSFAVLELEDGSTFTVFPNSRVTFRANQGDWRDLLDLWLGRVKVHIQKLGEQPNRNRVFTPTAVISVRGTVFDVVIEDDFDTTLVSVDQGLVEVRHRLIGESKTKQVQAGEYIRVYKNEPLARSVVDRNAVASGVVRAATEALYTILIRSRSGGGSPVPAGGGGPGLPGDTGGGETPTPPSGDGGPATPQTPPVPPPPPTPPPPGG